MKCTLPEIGILNEVKDLRDRNLLCPLLILLRLRSTAQIRKGFKGIVHIIEIQRQEATSIKTVFFFSLPLLHINAVLPAK